MVILNEAKPKYEKLDEILENKMTDIRFSNQVTMIIDLKEILRKFFRPDLSAKNYSTKSLIEEISSDVLNTIGHYRNYFFKRGKYTNFYILDSMKKSDELDKFYPNYRNEFYSKYTDISDKPADGMSRAEFESMLVENDYKRYVISKVRAAIMITGRLFPHVYTIDSSDYGDVVYSKLIIENIKSNELIFILSNDQIMFQLVSNNVSVITPKGIKAELVTDKNLYNIVSKKEDISPLSITIYPLVLSLAGVKKYSIENVKGVAFNRAVTLLETLISDGKIESIAGIALPIEYSKLDPTNKLEKIFIDNQKLIDLNYTVIRGDLFLNRNKKILLTKITADYQKKYSIEEIKRLNEKIFVSNPLQLEMLLRGEKI